MVDLSDATDAAYNQNPQNWEGTFTLGSFTTTAPFNANDVTGSAGFQGSDVVAGRVTTVTLSGLDPNNPMLGLTPETFAVGYRTSGGPAGTLTVEAVTEPSGFVNGSFHYFGLAG
jgi:hypothetical protein